jgi:hypothetical protein
LVGIGTDAVQTQITAFLKVNLRQRWVHIMAIVANLTLVNAQPATLENVMMKLLIQNLNTSPLRTRLYVEECRRRSRKWLAALKASQFYYYFLLVQIHHDKIKQTTTVL